MTSGVTSIEFAPLLAWPWLAALGAIGAALLSFAFLRRLPGVPLRGLALLAGLLALANPSLLDEEREALADVAIVVVDDSPSQGIGERASRAETAVAQIEERLDRREDLEPRVVATSTTRADLGEGTRLLRAIERALADVPKDRVAGVVVISDGQTHEPEERLASFDPGGPVHLLLTGDRHERDRRLVIEEAPRYGLVDAGLHLNFRVEDQGGDSELPATVVIRVDGGEPRSRRVPVGVTQVLPFTLSHSGETLIEIEVATVADELSDRNNRTVVSISGVRDRLRVLLVSGEPHAGERTWRNILKSDPSVDLVHFTILRPPEKQDGTPIRELSLISFPTRELFQTKLSEFDLIIFDRYRRRGVLPDIYLKNVADYVAEGGAILVAAGPAFATPLSLHRTSLKSVLPSQPTGRLLTEGFRPRLSAVGQRHPVTADLAGAEGETPSWGRWFRMVDVEVETGQVLMQGIAERPLLILDRVGEGRVAQLLSDHVWLWARGFEGGGPQAELLRRVAHWLMKEPDLEEEDLSARVAAGRMTVHRRSLSEAPVEITVTTPSGASRRITLTPAADGRARAAIDVDEPGLYRLSDGQRAQIVAVGDLNPREYADLRATSAPLEPVIRRGGGGVAWLVDGLPSFRRVAAGRDASGRGWMGLRANGEYRVTGVDQIPLMPALVVLALVLGLTAMAWYREGR